MQDFEANVRRSFAAQRTMAYLGAELERVESGAVRIALPFREDLTQQHGFMHGGIITTIADTASGYAALTLMPGDGEVLSVELKVNFLRPAKGNRFVASAEVVKAGRTLTVARCDVRSDIADGPVATMLATLIAAR